MFPYPVGILEYDRSLNFNIRVMFTFYIDLSIIKTCEVYNSTYLVFLCQTADDYYPYNYYIGTVHPENLLSEE